MRMQGAIRGRFALQSRSLKMHAMSTRILSSPRSRTTKMRPDTSLGYRCAVNSWPEASRSLFSSNFGSVKMAYLRAPMLLRVSANHTTEHVAVNRPATQNRSKVAERWPPLVTRYRGKAAAGAIPLQQNCLSEVCTSHNDSHIAVRSKYRGHGARRQTENDKQN